ncbi:MAG: hypothetical protein E6713_14355 [Sporomusaceae bacterium]|nr:hypothetical protein [Sporomusaceae bacterium]
MPVLTEMEKIPERVWVDFLRANLFPPEEIPCIVPLEKSFFMLSIPDAGFLVTAKRLVIYRKKFMKGLVKHDDVFLTDLDKISCEEATKGYQFYFHFVDGREYWVKLAVTQGEAELIQKSLFNLAPQLHSEIALF